MEDVAGTTAVEEARGISLLKQAERRRAEDSDTLFLEVPSWNGDLIAEYKVVDRTRLDAMVRKIQQMARNSNSNSSSTRTAADIDLILEANVGLYAYDPDGGDSEEERRVPIEDEHGTVTYDRVGPVLDQVFRSSREAVLYVMKNNAVAISTHALAIARWMRDPSKDPMEGLD